MDGEHRTYPVQDEGSGQAVAQAAPRCASCAGGADPDRVLAVAGACACGAVGALYSVTEPTAAAMRAAVALFGPPLADGAGGAFDGEWYAGRAAVIDRETGLPELLALLKRTWEEAVEPEVPLDSVVDCIHCGGTGEHAEDCLLLLLPAAIAKAEARP